MTVTTTCGGSHPRSKSISAGTRRSRARTCSGRPPRPSDVTFHTRSGALPAAHRTDGAITLDFPVAEPVPEEPIPELFDALGIEPIEFLRTDGDFFMCVVAQAATVRKLAPDFGRLRGLVDVRGVYVTARADDDAAHDIVSRCFAPRVGIDEDPVTGSMHCVLVAYWGPRLGKDEFARLPGVGARR